MKKEYKRMSGFTNNFPVTAVNMARIKRYIFRTFPGFAFDFRRVSEETKRKYNIVGNTLKSPNHFTSLSVSNILKVNAYVEGIFRCHCQNCNERIVEAVIMKGIKVDYLEKYDKVLCQ